MQRLRCMRISATLNRWTYRFLVG
uniref:Uncharacterized protein n=1 Tax=Arundo donax TaxID=35708 RepID=A0A0A9H8A1_ARUDO